MGGTESVPSEANHTGITSHNIFEAMLFQDKEAAQFFLKRMTESVNQVSQGKMRIIDELLSSCYFTAAELQEMGANSQARGLNVSLSASVDFARWFLPILLSSPEVSTDPLTSLDFQSAYGYTNMAEDKYKNYCPPLFVCVAGGHLDLVKMLLAHGASMQDADTFVNKSVNVTGIEYAIQKGNVATVELLLNAGAKIRDFCQLGPIMHVAAPHPEMLALLIARGLNPRCSNPEGRTLLQQVCHIGAADSLQFLLEHTGARHDASYISANGRTLFGVAKRGKEKHEKLIAQLASVRFPTTSVGCQFQWDKLFAYLNSVGFIEEHRVPTGVERPAEYECRLNALDTAAAVSLLACAHACTGVNTANFTVVGNDNPELSSATATTGTATAAVAPLLLNYASLPADARRWDARTTLSYLVKKDVFPAPTSAEETAAHPVVAYNFTGGIALSCSKEDFDELFRGVVKLPVHVRMALWSAVVELRFEQGRRT